MRKVILVSALILISLNGITQILKPAKWNFSYSQKDNTVYELTFEAVIDKGWHIYGQDIPDLPIATSFEFSEGVNIIENVRPETPPEKKYDSAQMMELESFEEKVVFKALVEVKDEHVSKIEGVVTYSACNDNTCTLPIDVEFSHEISEVPQSNEASKSLWGIFFFALLAGFVASITPCVYPMIPLTVSYFMQSNATRTRAIFQGIFYGLSIIFIYTLIGFISGLLKFDLTRLISSSPITNMILFVLFIVLAISFFGLFEIVIPGNIGNKIDQKTEKSGFLFGAFLMALATTIVSFSCTGLFAGAVLGKAMYGDIITPVVGMFGFGLSFSIPFVFLAIFPKAIENLPKSGGWLNSVKVTTAFILLIFSLVFLGNAGFNFITRDVVLVIAIALFILLGIYLMGKIKFAHDSDVKHISIFRFLLIVISFAIAIYLFPGLFGAPLKSLSPFLPDKETLSFDLTKYKSSATAINEEETELCEETPKYADMFYMPHNLNGYFDYKQALACAKELDKPIFLNFTGKWCKNCKKMYASVWSDPEVLNILKNDFILVSLYTDVNHKLPESEWITSKVDGKEKKTLARVNGNLELEKFKSNALPLYAIIDSEGNVLTDKEYYTYNLNIPEFIAYLNDGKKNYVSTKPKEEEPVSLDFGW